MHLIGLSLFILFSIFGSFSAQANERFHISGIAGVVLTDICGEVLAEAYRELGIDIEIQRFPAQRSILESNAGRTDGELFRPTGIEQKFENLMMVPAPLCSAGISVFTRGQDFKVDGWDSLKPYRIGILNGHQGATQGTKGMNVVKVRSPRQMIQMLAHGRVDLILLTPIVGLTAIKDVGIGGISLLEPPVVTENLYHYVHKRHQEIAPKLAAVLKRLAARGRIKEVEEEYLSRH